MLSCPHTDKSLVPPFLRLRLKRALLHVPRYPFIPHRPIRPLQRILTVQPSLAPRPALESLQPSKPRRVITRRPPSFRQRRVQHRQTGRHDTKEDINHDPRELLLERPRKIEVRVDARLHNLPHHAADAAQRADREQKTQSDLLPRRQVAHAEQHDERHSQEGEVARAVDDGEAVAERVAVEALGPRRVAPEGQRAEFEAGGPGALEQFGEEGRDHEADAEGEEDVVRDHPAAGREAREAAVEEDDGDLDEADGHPEDDDAAEAELGGKHTNIVSLVLPHFVRCGSISQYVIRDARTQSPSRFPERAATLTS